MTRIFWNFNLKAAITILSPELGAHLQSDSRGLEAISESPVPPQEGAAQGNLVSEIDGKTEIAFNPDSKKLTSYSPEICNWSLKGLFVHK